MINLVTYIHDHWLWSKTAFGVGDRTAAIAKQVERDLDIIEGATNADEVLGEWVDIILHGIDGALRSGATPMAVAQAMMNRQWTNVATRQTPLNEPIPGHAGDAAV